MKSETLPSFWEAYRLLEEDIRQRSRKAYKLWINNPFHPSLHFKCVNTREGVWSVRITHGYRALGILENDTVTWFWIGDYLRQFS